MPPARNAMEMLKKPSRRSFLFGAAMATGAIVAMGARSTESGPMPERPSQRVRQRISEHARKYYRTMRK